MHLWVVQLTISWSCLLHETIQSMTSYAQTLTLVPKLWPWCWNTQESTTQAPKRAYDSLLIWSSRSSKRPFSFEFQEFKQPNISVYFIQDLDMPLFKLLSFFGFGFCAFLFDLVLLFWILCSLGSCFCVQSNLWFGLVIFICFFVVLLVLILYFLLFLWHKIQWRYISINRIYLIYFF